MEASGRLRPGRQTPSSSSHAHQIFTDASNEGMGSSSRRLHSQRSVVHSRKQARCQFLGLKVVRLALKCFEDLNRDQTVPIATDNTTIVSYIYKEGV